MSFPPVNPAATPEAIHRLAFLYTIRGKRVMSGQHNFPGALDSFSREVAEIGGAYPAVWGCDFGFSADDQDGVQYRDRIVEESIRQHVTGSIVTLMWHAVRPTHDEPVTFKDNILGRLSDEDWTELITPGSRLHTRWTAQVDVIAQLLARIQAAKVPVLWRPYHEMNGNWFWWGDRPGPDGYVRLYRMLFDRLVHHHGLHNLIWVWNANAPNANAFAYADYFPGLDVVDVLATDVYRSEYRTEDYEALKTLAGGKPIALGEVGILPTPDLLRQEPDWTWFMTWSGFIASSNAPEAVRALYQDPRTLNRPATG